MRVSKIGKKLLVMLLIVAIILPCSAEVLATAEEAFGFEEPITVVENVENLEEEVLPEDVLSDEV